jgi:hypothetical protein
MRGWRGDPAVEAMEALQAQTEAGRHCERMTTEECSLTLMYSVLV